MTASRGALREVASLRGWRVGVDALPAHVCFFTIAYLAVKTGGFPGLARTFLLVLALGIYFSYGVLVNDYFDRELDTAAGKSSPKRGHGLPKGWVAALLVGLLGADLVLVWAIGGGPVFGSLWVAALALATAYSAPPARLRARAVPGFVADSLIEKPLPVLIVFAFFGYYGPEILIFPVMAELLDSVFKHQLEDLEVDRGQGVRSLAVALGKQRSAAAVSRIFDPLDCVAVAVFFATPLVALPSSRTLMAAASAVLAVGVVAFAWLQQRGRVRAGFPFKDPPLVGFLDFGFRTLALAALTASAALLLPGLLPFALLVAVSVVLYAGGPLRLAGDFVRYVTGRGGRSGAGP